MLAVTRRRQHWGPLLVAFIAAIALHVAVMGLALMLNTLFEDTTPDAPPVTAKPKAPAEPELRIQTISEEQLAQLLKKQPEPKPEAPPKPEPEPPKETPPPPQPELNKKVVIQETNEQKPTKADYLSEQANKTEQETRAKQTTMKDVLPGKPAPEPEDDAGQPDPDPQRDKRDEDAKEATKKPTEIAMSVPNPKPAKDLSAPQENAPNKTAPPNTTQEPIKESEDGPMVYKDFRKNKNDQQDFVDPDAQDTPLVKRSDPQQKPQTGQPNPSKIFNAPNVAEYERAFGKQDDAPLTEQPTNKRRRMFSNIKRRQQNLRASLENMIPEIAPGNHTSVNAHPAVYAGYMASLHRKIHDRWANDYLLSIDTSYPRSHPLQNPALHVLLEFVILAETGKFEAVNIVQSSGELLFDAEAVDTAWAIGDKPNPPPQIVSPNGKIYIHWNFWRDGRQCGVFGASVFLLNDKGQTVQKRADSAPM